MNKIIIAIIITLVSTGFAQKQLTDAQKTKLAYFMYEKKERKAKASSGKRFVNSTRSYGNTAIVKGITISIRNASLEEIKSTRMFNEKQLAEYKSALKYFQMYKITFINKGKESARFSPYSQTFFTEHSYVSKAKRRDGFDHSFVSAFGDYAGKLFTQFVKSGSVGCNYVLLPRVKKLIASVGIDIGNKEYKTVALEIGNGNRMIKL